MSFKAPKRIVEENDTVILYLGVTQMYSIDVNSKIKNKHGQLVDYTHQTPYGSIKVETLIGKEYGSKVELSRGFAHVLQANPELWTQNLPHRTQILYTPDISMILFQLEIRPGSVVIEAGTGSGSLSHYFLRAIKDSGHLYTFDFHEDRANIAREEFAFHGLGDFVTVQHRDVCANGFTEELNGKADAIFLDLPAPYVALEHVVKVMKDDGGRFCGFSPCIEQVQKTCLKLEELGFLEIRTMEVLQTEHIVKDRFIQEPVYEFVKTKKSEESNGAITAKEEKQSMKTRKILTSYNPPMQPGHSGYLTFATLPPIFMR